MLPPPPHNIILFELYFNVKFPLFRLLQFLSDAKSTILSIEQENIKILHQPNSLPLTCYEKFISVYHLSSNIKH